MQYEKDTGGVLSSGRRWYHDACGAAFALELVGERWSLLIMRELLFGPRRFGELRDTLHGITAKVLTERLEGLVATGIVARRKLPSPASVQVYELTPWGQRSERAIMELGRWAAASPDHDLTLPLSAAGLMLSLRTMFDDTLARGFAFRIGLDFGAETFVVEVGANGLTVRRGEIDAVDAVITTSPSTLAAIIYAGLPLAMAEADGSVALAGDRSVVERLTTLFPLPAKRDAKS
jgi:DNA-binding HxlR family transcriptional regulator/putative sterol carrier protein